MQPRRLEGRGRAVVRVADEVAALAVLPEDVRLEQRRRQQPAQQARRHKGLRAELPREIARDEQRGARGRVGARVARHEPRPLALQEGRARHVVEAEGVVRREDERAVEAARVRHDVVHVHDGRAAEDHDLFDARPLRVGLHDDAGHAAEVERRVVPRRHLQVAPLHVLLAEWLEDVRDPPLALGEHVGLALIVRHVIAVVGRDVPPAKVGRRHGQPRVCVPQLHVVPLADEAQPAAVRRLLHGDALDGVRVERDAEDGDEVGVRPDLGRQRREGVLLERVLSQLHVHLRVDRLGLRAEVGLVRARLLPPLLCLGRLGRAVLRVGHEAAHVARAEQTRPVARLYLLRHRPPRAALVGKGDGAHDGLHHRVAVLAVCL